MGRARLILGICDRFHCLPSQVLAEDSELIRLLEIERLAGPAHVPGPHQQ